MMNCLMHVGYMLYFVDFGKNIVRRTCLDNESVINVIGLS
jgi:hypothetical protein